jgi:hypothetical protein
MSDDEAQARLDNYLGHMLEAAQLARQYVEGVSKDEFLTDRRTQQAVVLNLMTIGEGRAHRQRMQRLCGGTSRDSVGADARHAQSHGSRLLRRGPEYRVGYDSEFVTKARIPTAESY